MPAAVRRCSAYQIVARVRTLESETRRQITVPARIWRRSDQPSEQMAIAQAWADHYDQTALLLRHMPSPSIVADAEQLGIITTSQAAAYQLDGSVPDEDDLAPTLTLRDMATEHDVARREDHRDGRAYRDHLRFLDVFLEWSGLELLEDLRTEHATAWVEEMKRRGWSRDTRRHALYFLKLAARQGMRHGIPNALAEVRLDPSDPGQAMTDVEAWAMADIAIIHNVISMQHAELPEHQRDHRPLAAILLQALCGLRPSEVCRLSVGGIDLAQGIVSIGIGVGAGRVKRSASRRQLPMPGIVSDALRPLVATRRQEETLILSRAIHHPGPFDTGDGTFASWLRPIMSAIIPACELPPKYLRKGFATWAVSLGLPTQDIEHYMGHSHAFLARVTQRHYLSQALAYQCKPTAKKLDTAFRKLLKSTRKRAIRRVKDMQNS